MSAVENRLEQLQASIDDVPELTASRIAAELGDIKRLIGELPQSSPSTFRELWQRSVQPALQWQRWPLNTVRLSLRIVAFFVLLIGLASSFYSLFPKVSVQAGEPLDQRFTMLTPMTVSNDSVLPLFNVRFLCGIGAIQAYSLLPTPDWRQANFDYKSRVRYAHEASWEQILPGQKATTDQFCPMLQENNEPMYADISIIVQFDYLWGLRKDLEQSFRLITMRNAEGKVLWMQQPLKATTK